jgi:hypothetical protein
VNPDLPAIPTIDPKLLSEHQSEHRRLDRALLEASPPVSTLLTRFALRTLVAAVANIRPSLRGGSGPPLFPPPRRFLSAVDRARLDGVAAAYRHADSRLAMIQLGFEKPPAVRAETPYVLHALAEGRMDNPDETNPGMIRGVEFGGNLPIAPYPPARREHCRDLLEAALRAAAPAATPACVRAAWLLYVIGEIHPFTDGNGRVARLLYLMVTGDDMPRTVDWGVVEQLRYHQDPWAMTLTERDVGPCAALATELSTRGARLMSERLSVLARLVPEIGRLLAMAPPCPELVAAVWLRRSARLDEMALDIGLGYRDAHMTAESLVGARILERSTSEGAPLPARPTYGVTPAVASAIEAAITTIRTS